MNTIALPRQTNVSENIRVTIKRLASNNGGLARFVRALGQPYKRTWERVNRNQGDLIDLVVTLAQNGLDEPLRMAADASGLDITPKIKFLRKGRSPVKPVRSYALDLHHATSTVTMLVEAALEDRMIDKREREQVNSAIYKLRKKMAELQARIEREG